MKKTPSPKKASTARKKVVTASTLPTSFLLVAEAALNADAHDAGIAEKFDLALRLIEPILTRENLIGRD